LVEAAVGRRHLVLRTDRLVQHGLFDVDALGGELLLARHPAIQRVHRVQQAHAERRAGANAAAGRQVAVVVQFDTAVEAQKRRIRAPPCAISSISWQFSIFE
jgi:hypothetical protein